MYGLCQSVLEARSAQHDRRSRPSESRAISFIEVDESVGNIRRFHHDGQWFGSAVFSFAQSFDGSAVQGVDEQLVTSQAAKRNNFTGGKVANCFHHSVSAVQSMASVAGRTPYFGAARWTGNGLGVESAIERPSIFVPTIFAQ
jgi:hypothetical protein